ncbi:MAG: hypothetical protein LBP62_05900 [Clostridiales bacterium]|jgi:hypothetical protein|nr:hypothetical protein [Clostridiales bacterium]
MLDKYYYNKLQASEERSAYQAVYSALLRSERECGVSGIGNDSAEKVWEAVTLDHPEIINYPAPICQRRLKGRLVLYHFQYSNVDRGRYNESLDNAVNEIEKQLTSDVSGYSVIKAIFDYLTASVDYDGEAFNEYLSLIRTNPSDNVWTDFIDGRGAAFTPYGVVINKKGVSAGISRLFKILCGRFGIQCACVKAQLKDECSSPHRLNVVEIGCDRFFADVTSGLTLDELPIARYDYFLAPRRIIEKLLTIEEDFLCDNERENFFVKNNLRFTSVCDLKRYLAGYVFSSTNGEVRCHYDGGKLTDKELGDIFSEIVNAHCSYTKQMPTTSVKNGFCTGLITDAEE